MFIFFNKFKLFIKNFDELLIFWFPGVFIFLYFFLGNLDFIDVEKKEWITYFSFILISIILFFIHNSVNLIFNIYLKVIFTLIFLFYFFISIEYSYAQFFLILASIYLSLMIFFKKFSNNKIQFLVFSIIFYNI